MQGMPLVARVHGRHIERLNRTDSNVWPKGRMASGTLMWHAASRQWIIGNPKEDQRAQEVGGCSDGPYVVDLVNRIYWTC